MPPVTESRFRWGVATSAYQIEGGRTDGKSDSIWDRFAHRPGTILDGSTGDVACDHYHRWREDVALMSDLGVTSYRFSIGWTRVLPDGIGEPNRAGLDFYERLIDGLLDAGIEPMPTLYHWDLPQALQDRGGWQTRETVDAFVEYAETMSRAFGDRVSTWITHNEPWVAAMLGHLEGVHAPGLRSWDAALAAAHHILLSHGRATRAMRRIMPDAAIGIALDGRPSTPRSDDPVDVTANRHFDGFRNRWFFDPVFGNGYPPDMVEAYRLRGRLEGASWMRSGDTDEMAAPIDFLGINYYTGIEIAVGDEESEDTGVEPGPSPPDGYTEMGWKVTPDTLTEFLQRIHREYGPDSIVITENGASYSTGPDEHGRVPDRRRIEYLDEHVAAVERARANGVPVDGYFVWSLLDNFEWALGYSQRFGIVWVDHATGTRLPKDSFQWYRDRIAAGIS